MSLTACKVKLWAKAEADPTWQCSETIKLPDAVTAVDVIQHGEQTLLAIGLDSGALHICNIGKEGLRVSDVDRLDSSWVFGGLVDHDNAHAS